MSLPAQQVKTKQQEENHEMVVSLYAQYQADHVAAIRKASKIQRDLSRAEHEVGRIERHLQRIEEFCSKNNVSLTGDA